MFLKLLTCINDLIQSFFSVFDYKYIFKREKVISSNMYKNSVRNPLTILMHKINTEKVKYVPKNLNQ